MAIEVRHPESEELRAAMGAALDAFGEADEDEDWERERVSVRPERAVAAYDGGRPVGFSASYEFELSVPGGSVPTAGVTWVGVLPTHTRRGILRRFMEQLFEDARAHGEPLAALFASEASIYGRFGYGVATHGVELDAETKRVQFRDAAPSRGEIRFLDADEAYARFVPIYDRFRATRAGMLSRNEHWWRRQRIADYEHARRGASKRFNIVLELDGEDAAYAMYRVKDDWADGYPQGHVRVVEAFATSPVATRELWRFLFSVDLTTRVKTWPFDPASPLFLQLTDPRALHLKVWDALWLRLLDVGEALVRRSYAGDAEVVLEVRDDLLPENAGRYRIGAGGSERTTADADIALDVADLGSAYLGGFGFAALAEAGLVEERRAGAVERADGLFRTPLPPYCPEVF